MTAASAASRFCVSATFRIDRESAYEILNEKLSEFRDEEVQQAGDAKGGCKPRPGPQAEGRDREHAGQPADAPQVGRTVARELTRGLLGVLGLDVSTRRRRRSRKSLF